MDVDESFTEYVEARWSMLYRLATLLAGSANADELTRTALVRAYLVWPEVQEAASADDYVKRVLARTAVKDADLGAEAASGAAEVGVPPSRAGREKLWAEIAELVPRQRGVLVLRHYEGLSDVEIGHAVGCSTNTVTAEALALETGIDVADLRDELRLRSDEASVPFPPGGLPAAGGARGATPKPKTLVGLGGRRGRGRRGRPGPGDPGRGQDLRRGAPLTKHVRGGRPSLPQAAPERRAAAARVHRAPVAAPQ